MRKLANDFINGPKSVTLVSNIGVVGIDYAGNIIDAIDPGTEAYIVLCLNRKFWIVTDTERWQQIMSIVHAPIPPKVATKSRLVINNAMRLTFNDREFIKSRVEQELK